jgi:hypothetical protein
MYPLFYVRQVMPKEGDLILPLGKRLLCRMKCHLGIRAIVAKNNDVWKPAEQWKQAESNEGSTNGGMKYADLYLLSKMLDLPKSEALLGSYHAQYEIRDIKTDNPSYDFLNTSKPTFIPLRATAEGDGFTVSWNASTRTATVYGVSRWCN